MTYNILNDPAYSENDDNDLLNDIRQEINRCEYIPMRFSYRESDCIVQAVNQGIDSRLEGFTRSNFQWDNENRLCCNIHPSELQILIRRLLESDDETAESIADDIVYVMYDHYSD